MFTKKKGITNDNGVSSDVYWGLGLSTVLQVEEKQARAPFEDSVLKPGARLCN